MRGRFELNDPDKSALNVSGFNQIFDYIRWNNSKREKIAMTVPVFNELLIDVEKTI
ncbi:heme-binding protein [Acetobacterium paludosum]|uniref:heme-binding protein n=1 Tax=Acetobacterium paludosum TaxID=52693 RepID=UPI0014792520|nr:heme-binding protein [Acetobacterium paludosum]